VLVQNLLSKEHKRMVNTEKKIGYLELVRNNANFRNLWFGQIVSLLGDWFNLIASAALIAQLTGSMSAVGILFLLRSLTPFFVSLFAGVAVDRYNRKWLLIGADIVRGLTVLCFFLVRDANDIWLLYLLISIQSGISGLFFPARNAILPDLTSEHELGTANALSGTTWSTMLSLGAALGGLVSGLFGVYVAFGVDALTYFVSAYFLWSIHYVKPKQEDEDVDGFSLSQILIDYVDGIKFLLAHHNVLVIALQKTAISLIAFVPFELIYVMLSEERFRYGEGGGLGLGLMYAMVGLGSGIGPLFARYIVGDVDHSVRRAIAVAYVITLVGIAIAAPVISFPIFLFGTFLRAFGNGVIWVFSTQLLLQTLPDKVRGRVMGTEYALFTIASALAAVVAAWGLDLAGSATPILWIMAGLWLLPTAFWIWWNLGQKESTSIKIKAGA